MVTLYKMNAHCYMSASYHGVDCLMEHAPIVETLVLCSSEKKRVFSSCMKWLLGFPLLAWQVWQSCDIQFPERCKEDQSIQAKYDRSHWHQ